MVTMDTKKFLIIVVNEVKSKKKGDIKPPFLKMK